MPTIYLNNPNNFGIIYTYTNTINGKVYVGRTIEPERRQKTYIKELNENRAINRAMKKYGIENFSYKVIDSASDEDSLNFLERHYIQKFKSHTTQHGYNMTFGGNGMSGFKHKEESKRKMSRIRFEKPLSPKQKEVIEQYFNWKGKKRGHQTEDHKRKVVESRVGIPLSDEHKAKLAEKIACPHCLKIGGRTAMYRWHFDHCSKRTIHE